MTGSITANSKTSTATPVKKPFVFDYKKYQSKSISLGELDKIAGIILNSGTGKLESIVAGVKLIILLGWLVARKLLIDQALLVAKQEYEQNTTNDNRDEIDNEDLDKQ